MSDAMQALFQGDADGAQALLPPDGELDVFHAAAFGRTERLRELLPEHANAFSEDGFTPLHLAVFAGQGEAVQLLIDAGADLDVVSKGPIAQVTPLGTAAFARSLPMARLLLDAGADVNRKGPDEITPLQAAIEHGDEALAEELRRRGGLPA